MPDFIIEAIVFIWGICIGSFLNVCILRLPAGQSIVTPRSACPKCGAAIRFYDNIPIFSYLWLLGRCRHCRTSISPRYLMVELMTGLLAVGTYLKFGFTLPALIYFIFISVLVVITYIDLDHRIIPNRITYPGIPLFFLSTFLIPDMTLKNAALGLIAGGGSLYLVAWVYKLLTKKDGMGMGDIKLLAMIGALLGWQGVLFTIYMASAVGTVVGLTIMAVRRRNMKFAIPFGPFLSLGAITYLFFGRQIIHWYLYTF